MNQTIQIKNNSLFSIYIQKNESHSPLPPPIRRHCDSFRDHCANFSSNHVLLGDQEIRALLAEQFSPYILSAYDLLLPHAYKADMGRYAVLYAYGGIYADLATQFLNSPSTSALKAKGWLCNGIRRHNIWNGFMRCSKGEPLLLKALEMIAERVHQRYYGPNPVSITGPRLLHDTLVCNPELREGFHFYTVSALTPDAPHLNMAVLDDDSSIICLRNKRKTAGLRELGLLDSDYRAMWNERSVYLE